MRLQLVLVEWLDIESFSGWYTKKEARALEPVKCRDTGWILHRDDNKLVLFRSRNSGGQVGDVAVLPVGVIVRVTPLAPTDAHEAPSPEESPK